MNAYQIAEALGGRRVKVDGYKAPCPAHDDGSPSLSISQIGDRVLFHCWSGCSQSDVLGALRSRGLWSDSRQNTHAVPVKQSLRQEELDYMASFILIYCGEVERGGDPTPEETAMCREFLRRLRLEGVI